MQKSFLHMRHIVFVANLLFFFSGAVTVYVNSTFIEKRVGTEGVGIVYMIAAVLTILTLTYAARTLSRIGNRLFFLTFGTLHALSLAILVLPFTVPVQVVALITFLFSATILSFSLDIFFEHVTDPKGRGKARGVFLLFGNCGAVLGPIIAASIISIFDLKGIYAVALMLFALLTFVLYAGMKGFVDAKYTPHNARTTLGLAFKERILGRAIAANFLLQFFFAWMIVYTPIYLSQNLGISWETIGIIFAVMLTAFVILDYPLGKLADRIGSEKELAAIGFLIMAACVFGLAFLPLDNVIVITGLLFMSRVGAATVEAMTEIHFFKVIPESNPGLVSVFRDLRPVAYIVAPLLGTLTLAVLPFKMIFAVLGSIMLIGFFVALGMETNKVWWIRSHPN